MSTSFDDLRDNYTQLWSAMQERPEWTDRITRAAAGILSSKEDYKLVEDMTGVPWFVVGILHQMESTRNFKTHLHNGDPLTNYTVNVPAGRPFSGEPPFTWVESAVDAIRYAKLDHTPLLSVEALAYAFESYNGFRSRTQHNINSPYLWSGTQHYTKGKFIRDNVWDGEAVSAQVGSMPVLRRLIELDQSVSSALRTTTEPAFPSATVIGELDLKALQDKLSKAPLYQDEVDGIFGRQTRKAIRALLVQENIMDWVRWSDSRLFIAGQQAVCKRDKIDVGEIDGILGPRTKWALDVYAARQRGDLSVDTWRDDEDQNNPPDPSKQPPKSIVWPTQAEVRSGRSIFGSYGANQTKLVFPYPMKLAWDPQRVIRSTSCNIAVHDAAKRALKQVLQNYGIEKIQELRLDYFGGCLNIRRITGGSAMSMHSWGIAFDFDPERNGFRARSPEASFSGRAYRDWFEIWESEGAVALGRARNYDWMHIQFARLV